MAPIPFQSFLNERYQDAPVVPDDTPVSDTVFAMAARGSCRDFQDARIPRPVLDMLCAAALASPSKSDLQQRDLVLVSDPTLRQNIAGLVAGQEWIASAPTLFVFCGNNRRQRLLHDWKGIPFANDHLDAFFNAIGDAAIAMGAFVTAAESMGLGCCPISGVRNEAEAVSDFLGLPDHVFPFAGLAVGYPKQPPKISMRLPLSVTYHENQYTEENLRTAVANYDQSRSASQPYAAQRLVNLFGETQPYTWSDDKVRQYSQPERASFAGFVRAKGFRLD